jgi:exopolysaccharide production protein ExoQ
MTTDLNAIAMPPPQPSNRASLAFCVGFFFSFRVIAAVFFIRLVGVEPQVAAAATLALTFSLLSFVALSVMGSTSGETDAAFRLADVRWVLLFLAFSGCSLLWSETISPAVSSAYWCGPASDVAIVILLLRSQPAPIAAGSLVKGFVWGSCFVAAISWVMPSQYDMRLGDEDYFNANTIGNLCAFGVFFAQYLMRARRGRWSFAIFFLSITLVRSLSKTAIVAFLISEGHLLFHDRIMSRRTKTYVLIIVTVVVITFWGLFEAYYDIYTTYGNQSETLTGRTAIWAYVLDAASSRPWIGHGFDSMWKVVPVFGTFEARHAENEILEQLYCYGATGLVLLCGLYGSFYGKIRKLSNSSYRMIFSGLLIFVIIRGLAEAEPFDLLFPLWAIVLVSSLITHESAATMSTVVKAYPSGSNCGAEFKPTSEYPWLGPETTASLASTAKANSPTNVVAS